MAPADPPPERLSHVVFKIRHDCPVSIISRDFPKTEFFSWSVHRQEIVYARSQEQDEDALEQAVTRMPGHPTILKREGGLAWTYASGFPKSRSISWQLESARCLWLQPLQCREGWEYFDVIALDPARFGRLVDTLGKRFPLQVVRRSPLSPADLATSFFVPLSPAVRSLTPKQFEALSQAHKMEYYKQPRQTTTRDVAKSLGVSRSALEERLRNAENAVIGGVMSSLGALADRGRGKRPPSAH